VSRVERISECISAVSMQITDRANHPVRSHYYIARKFRHRIEAYIRAKANKHEDSFMSNSFVQPRSSASNIQHRIFIYKVSMNAFRVMHEVHNVSFYLSLLFDEQQRQKFNALHALLILELRILNQNLSTRASSHCVPQISLGIPTLLLLMTKNPQEES